VEQCIPFISVGAYGGSNTEAIVGGTLTLYQKEDIKRMLMRISSRAQQAMEVAYAIMYPYRIKRRRYNEINDTILVDQITIESCNVNSSPNLIKVLPGLPAYATNYDEINDILFEIENQLKIPQPPEISGRMENDDAKRTELNSNILERIRVIQIALVELKGKIDIAEDFLQNDTEFEIVTGDKLLGARKVLKPIPADFINRTEPVHTPPISIPNSDITQYKMTLKTLKKASFREGLCLAYTEITVDLIESIHRQELDDLPDVLKLFIYIVHRISPELTSSIRIGSAAIAQEKEDEGKGYYKNMDDKVRLILQDMDRDREYDTIRVAMLELDDEAKQISVVYLLSLLYEDNEYAYYSDMYKPRSFQPVSGMTIDSKLDSLHTIILAFYQPRNIVKGFDMARLALNKHLIREEGRRRIP